MKNKIYERYSSEPAKFDGFKVVPIREYDEDYEVMIGNEDGKKVLIASNESGCNRVCLDWNDIVNCVKENELGKE